MKIMRILASGVLSVLTAVSLDVASAATYGDTTGDVFTGAGGGILDITSVEVNSTATDLIFKINLAGDPVATDWGKYMVGIDSALGGDPAGNGWARPIGMASGMDYWLGSWVDGGNGAEVRVWGGASWGLQSATWGANPDGISTTKDSSSVTIQLAYAGLGLAPGSSFLFDIYTSGGGGGDGAIDALGNPGVTIGDWGNPYNSGGLVNGYTIPVPEPGTLAFLGLGGVLVGLRALRRR